MAAISTAPSAAIGIPKPCSSAITILRCTGACSRKPTWRDSYSEDCRCKIHLLTCGRWRRLDHETAIAPEPVHPQPWTPLSIVAPPGIVAAEFDRHPILPGSGAECRGGAVRFDLPCRSAGARRRCRSGAAHLAGADHRPGGGCGGYPPGRADRLQLRRPTPNPSTWRDSLPRSTISAMAAPPGIL